MEFCSIKGYEFIVYNLENHITVGFSTGKKSLNFNKNIESGKVSLENLKEWFKVEDVIYLNQVHGTNVYGYKKNDNIINSDGDGLVTSEKHTAIGVFTADCVPIILVDDKLKVIAALHSGWKGTLNNIALEGIKIMKNSYGSNVSNIKAFIGPHNKSCCYQVSEELIDTFKNCDLFKDEVISLGRNLDLERCIEIQLMSQGINKENIVSTNLCTYCSADVKLYSYRKTEESLGRLFSFVYTHGVEGQ